MTDILAVEGLKKRFDGVEAVKDISFTVTEGELFGFLGPNGAGKTTTINMLTGLARPDAGTIRIAGIDCTGSPRAAQHLIGVVPDESNLYPELSGFDNLCFCGALYGMRRTERESRARMLIDMFDLTAAADRRFGGYSRGMKRRLTIAAGIIHRPPILFLDEPTTGIDVGGARQLRRIISDLHRDGTTIFLTTHYIEEAERLCDRVAFIVSGTVVRIDTVQNLIQPVLDTHVLQISGGPVPEEVSGSLAAAFPALTFSTPEPGLIRIEAREPIPAGRLIRHIEDAGISVMEARRLQPSLEEVFVSLTGIGADAMRREKEKKGGGGQ